MIFSDFGQKHPPKRCPDLVTSYLGIESSDASFTNFELYVFDVDHVAKIRSELSITILEKKTEQNYRLKKKVT